MYSCID